MKIAPMVAPTSAASAAEHGAEQDAAGDREIDAARKRERDHRDIERDVARQRGELVRGDERVERRVMAHQRLERELPVPADRNHDRPTTTTERRRAARAAAARAAERPAPSAGDGGPLSTVMVDCGHDPGGSTFGGRHGGRERADLSGPLPAEGPFHRLLTPSRACASAAASH